MLESTWYNFGETSVVSKITRDPYIYSVREIFLSADIKRIDNRIIKYLERKANKGALFTVEFDEKRAVLLAKDNDLSPKSMLVVPNAPMGRANEKRSSYLREKFNIPNDKKIALYTGGIADYNLTYEHIASIEAWPDNVVLVIHCWGSEEEITKLIKFAQKFNREIYFSTEMLPFQEIDQLYRSADIGFALYGDQDLNHKYAGLSSGKMFNFMKACVPIMEIVRDCVGYLKMYLKNYVKFILNKKIEKPDLRRYKFDRALRKGRMKYNWRLIFDTKLKEFTKREDWINE